MTVLVSIFVVLFGLAFGSFLNVCIVRLPRHESILHPPSHCPRCLHRLGPLENIPLLSWIVLRARCRGCRLPISWRYPAIELTTALLFLLCGIRFGLGRVGIASMVLCLLLLGLAAMDADCMTLPDSFTLSGIGVGLIYVAGLPAISLQQRLVRVGIAVAWAVAAALVLLLIRWVYLLIRHQEGLGLGDVKLLAMIAVWMGPKLAAEVLFFGIVSAALYGMAWMVLHPGPRARHVPLPLGSFLCGSGLLVLFEGDAILRWYLSFFR